MLICRLFLFLMIMTIYCTDWHLITAFIKLFIDKLFVPTAISFLCLFFRDFSFYEQLQELRTKLCQQLLNDLFREQIRLYDLVIFMIELYLFFHVNMLDL